MGQEMREVIRGVVRDHRVPNDYTSRFLQPIHTKAFAKVAKRYLLVKMLKSMHAALPLYMLFVVSVPYFVSIVAYRYWVTGTLPPLF